MVSYNESYLYVLLRVPMIPLLVLIAHLPVTTGSLQSDGQVDPAE